MGNKKAVLIGIAAVLLAIAGWRFAGVARRGANSDIGRTYTYKCGACSAEFEMDEAALRSHERAGRVETPEGGYKKYPCAECGEIAAWYHEVM